MAKQTVNIGTSANARNGDPLRVAFDKINDNFDELYTALGLDEAPLNLGAFEFTGSTLTTTDSSTITIDQATTITSDLTVGGDILPSGTLKADLGSTTNRFRDLYLSGSTINLGGTTLSVVGGNLQVGGTDIKDVVTAAGVDYSEIQNTPTIPTAVSDLTNDTGFITSASALTAGSNIPTLEAAYTAARGTLDVLLNAGEYGAQLAPPSDYTYYEIAVQQKAVNPLIPDEVVSEALNVLNAYNAWQDEIEAETATITVGDREWKFKGDGTVDGLYVNGDIQGSVFADDSTLLVDGVNGKIVGNVDTSLIETNLIISQGGNFNETGNSLVVGAANGTATGGYVVVGGGTGTAGDGGSASLAGGTGSAGDGGYATVGGGTGSVDGGDVFLGGGNGTGGNGGTAYINGGQGSAGNGGGVQIVGGPGSVADGVIDIGTQATSQVNIQNAVIQGDLTGSVFGDDSTLLVDGVAGKIVGDIETNSLTIGGTGFVNFNNDAFDDTYYGGFTTDKSILQINGANYLAGSDDGGGVVISGGSARNGGNNGDVIIASGGGGADGTGYISLLSANITASGTWIGTQTMDIKGSVFADDSTVLVDGVNGVIPTSVLEGDIPINSVDKFVNRSTFTSDFTINAGSATLLQFDAFQGSRAFDAVTYQWAPANTGLYRLDVVLGLTASEADQPLIVFLYNVTDNANQIQLYNGIFSGTVLSMSGTTYLTAGKNYQFGIIQNVSGDAIVLDKDLTSAGIEELTRV